MNSDIVIKQGKDCYRIRYNVRERTWEIYHSATGDELGTATYSRRPLKEIEYLESLFPGLRQAMVAHKEEKANR